MPFNKRCVGLLYLQLRGVGQRCKIYWVRDAKFISHIYISIDYNWNMEIT